MLTVGRIIPGDIAFSFRALGVGSLLLLLRCLYSNDVLWPASFNALS